MNVLGAQASRDTPHCIVFLVTPGACYGTSTREPPRRRMILPITVRLPSIFYSAREQSRSYRARSGFSSSCRDQTGNAIGRATAPAVEIVLCTRLRDHSLDYAKRIADHIYRHGTASAPSRLGGRRRDAFRRR